MKAVINGKTYNTSSATLVCDLPCSANRGDFGWHDTSLYITKKRNFFLAGEGGARSMWSEPIGNNGSIGGRGLRPVSEQEARDYMEAANCDEGDFAAVGLDVEEA
ncbi:MAG: hypothetical protein OEU93_08465 [Rubrivivax sp.]|nr:hypothetical protein [Rubrivivax sp.]